MDYDVSLDRKKQARLKKSEGHLASVESITDGASVTSSRASRPWIKDPMADAKPVTDPVLRSKISSVTSPGGRISAKVRGQGRLDIRGQGLFGYSFKFYYFSIHIVFYWLSGF